MKNAMNGCKLFRNAQSKQQANAQSQMQSASKCNHSVRKLFRALELMCIVVNMPQWSSNG